MSKKIAIKTIAVVAVCAGVVALDMGYFKDDLSRSSNPSSKKDDSTDRNVLVVEKTNQKNTIISKTVDSKSPVIPSPGKENVEILSKLPDKDLHSSIPSNVRFLVEPEKKILSDQVIFRFDPKSNIGKLINTSPELALKKFEVDKKSSISFIRRGSNYAILKVSFTANDEVTKGKELKKLVSSITNMNGIQGIEEDVFVRPSFVPNDSRYSEQWYLNKALMGGANVSPAWDSTTGTKNGKSAIIAIVDTGITQHSDLVGNLIQGFDFISDSARSGDGTGWDADASDVGDGVTSAEANLAGGSLYGCEPRASSWHGTHVAGIAASVGGNGVGIVGVAPSSKILPVRVMGKCGGYMSDVSEGVRWAAGLPVEGADVNVNKANVINLSLGGRGACPSYFQAAIDDAKKAGSVVVVAAGNSAIDAKDFMPANCQGVITVGAVAQNGDRTYYSNFGSKVHISAPGGDAREASTMLSTLNSGEFSLGSESYGFYQGTSMAAPVVSGGIALAFSKNEKLGASGAFALITKMASKFPSGSDCEKRKNCGVGIIDIGAAIGQAEKYVPDLVISKIFTTNGIVVPNVTFDVNVNMLNIGLSPTSVSQGGKIEIYISSTTGENSLKIGEALVPDIGGMNTNAQKIVKISNLKIGSDTLFANLQPGRYGLTAKFISGDWEENKENNASKIVQVDYLLPTMTLTKKIYVNQAPADLNFSAAFNDSRIARLAIGGDWKYEWVFTNGTVTSAVGQKAMLKMTEPGNGTATLNLKHMPSGYQSSSTIGYEIGKAEDSVITFSEVASNKYLRAPVTYRFNPAISVGHPLDRLASLKWDLNNGEMTSNKMNAIITFLPGTHTIKATATTKMGFTANFEKTLIIKENQLPVCNIDYSSPIGQPSVLFSATCSDADGVIKGIAWYINGRRASAQPRSPNTFRVQTDGSGIMTVKVVAVDDAKAFGESQVTVAY